MLSYRPDPHCSLYNPCLLMPHAGRTYPTDCAFSTSICEAIVVENYDCAANGFATLLSPDTCPLQQ
jgi:hypothetical protein